MKNVYILFITVLLTLSSTTMAQKVDAKNSFSASVGAWERCYSLMEGTISHKIGTVAAIEYQRHFDDRYALRIKGGSGAITNNDYSEIYRHVGLSAGIMVTPFGRKMPNFKTGLSLLFIVDNTELNNPEGRLGMEFRYLYGLELPVRFLIFDKPKWFLGIGCDVQWGTYTSATKYGFYTSNSMITYGLKF